jgi:hypothetical protein
LSDWLAVEHLDEAAARVFDGDLGAKVNLGEGNANGSRERGMGGDGVGFAWAVQL